jgi:transposase
MRMIREVLRLHYSCGLSYKRVSAALGCSRGAVKDYVHRASKAGLTWTAVIALDDTQLERRVFPSKREHCGRPLPDWNYVHDELKKKGVTLVLLWSEYRQEHPDGYGLSQFCRLYRLFVNDLNLVMRQEHKAGEKAFSDFAGKRLEILDPESGKNFPAYLFVCTLGASSFTYADLFTDESTESWCLGHAAAFEYFAGVPKIVVPDNPKPVVTRACRYEADINPSFAHMAAHFDIAIIPARVRRPKDKAKVEAAVGVVTRWIIAALRERTFLSLDEARAAVRCLLDDLNDRHFKKLHCSRRDLHQSIDRPALKPLPTSPYIYTEFKKVSVKSDYHVEFDRHFYSVPYQLRGASVEIRATADTVEIAHKGLTIVRHLRSFAENQATSLAAHQPKSHQLYDQQQLLDRIWESAAHLGPSTLAVMEAIVQRQKHPELSYRSCYGILGLAKKFGDSTLETACRRALRSDSLSYTAVKSILTCNFDRCGTALRSDQIRPVREQSSRTT